MNMKRQDGQHGLTEKIHFPPSPNCLLWVLLLAPHGAPCLIPRRNEIPENSAPGSPWQNCWHVQPPPIPTSSSHGKTSEGQNHGISVHVHVHTHTPQTENKNLVFLTTSSWQVLIPNYSNMNSDKEKGGKPLDGSSIYSWPFKVGFNCTGPCTCKFFSINISKNFLEVSCQLH